MDSTPNPSTPACIGHYQLLEPIGRGGMGLVFRARDTRLEREVAIKCLRTELFSEHYIERFKREALLLAKLNHPNIVQIYDFIEAPEQLALVMELVDGQNLQTYLREHIAPMSQRLHWLTQIAEGLAIAHDAGIIHRDLKAENILINKRGQAKITDLGIAKSQDFNATLTDHVAGSYCSMSPEQAMGENISFKSDLFSLGILAYQLLCGAHPFGDTGNKLQIMQRIISHPPTPPHQHNPDLPAEFVDLLGQLLSKDPNKRPDNTHWVAAQFKKLSAMNVHDNIASDDTQALAMPHTNINNNGITRNARTQDHPTFETRFVAVAPARVSPWTKIKNYIAANKIVMSSAALSVLMITGVIVWQLQPKPPKYVAVIPPKLTAEGMQESQQELVKGAVYDAIQQSVIQLDNYYLIPREEIVDAKGDNETVRRATAADELITTDIQCKVESCTITLSRLVPDSESQDSRLRVQEVKTIDVLTDNYLSVAEIVQNNTGNLYHENITNRLQEINKKDYAVFLEANHAMRNTGASDEIIKNLDNISIAAKKLPSVQTLYREAALDLYHQSKKDIYLEKAKAYIQQNKNKNKNAAYFYNIYSLQIAQKDFDGAEKTISLLKKLNASHSTINELYAHIMIAKGDYSSAITFFQKSIDAKKTANNLLNISYVYLNSGNNILAKQFLKESLLLSPKFYKSHSLHGLIALLEGDTKTAITAFLEVTNQNKNDIHNLGNLGLCYLLEKDYTTAINIFERIEKLDPENTTHSLNKADAENLAGNTEKANQIYQNIVDVITLKNTRQTDLRNLAQAYAHLGKVSDSLIALQELEKTTATDIDTTYTAALIHTLSGNNASALLHIENTLKNGMHPIWFSFSWFDNLCNGTNFNPLMEKYGEPERCAPQLIKNS